MWTNNKIRIMKIDTEDNYLCKDGKVRTSSYDDLSDALVLSDRNEVVKL